MEASGAGYRAASTARATDAWNVVGILRPEDAA